jgi:hypothetical protein
MRAPLGPVILIAFLSVPSFTAAGSHPTLQYGDQVRLQLAARAPSSIIGTIHSVNDSSLTLSIGGAKDVRENYAWTSLRRLQRYEGTHSHMLFGALAGLCVGYLIAGATAPSNASVFDMEEDLNQALLITVGGLVVGTGVGASMHSEEWRTIPLDPNGHPR